MLHDLSLAQTFLLPPWEIAMAITVSGSNPTQVAVASNTITTNTTHPTGAPNARSYVIADDIIGLIPAGRFVGGFGLLLQTTDTAGAIAMTNNGSILATGEPTNALELLGNGGAVTYGGTGTITNYSAAFGSHALSISNVGAGSVNATIDNDLSANNGHAVLIFTQNGGINFTQSAGTVLSNAVRGTGFNT